MSKTFETTILVLWAISAGAVGQNAGLCATADERPAMQISVLQQELMAAALTCGETARNDYNVFQTSFSPALVASDRQLLALFHRVMGKDGPAGYNAFKAKVAKEMERRRIRDQAAFCDGAAAKARASLALRTRSPRNPAAQRLAALRDFAGEATPDDDAWSIPACDIDPPNVIPLPNPLRLAQGLADTPTGRPVAPTSNPQ